MPAHRYVEEIGSAAMLVTKMSAGVPPEVNLRIPLHASNKLDKQGWGSDWLSCWSPRGQQVSHQR